MVVLTVAEDVWNVQKSCVTFYYLVAKRLRILDKI
ncbi:hypothetical protein MEC_00280 [Bartonella alsatica IBS 382]|uniref:Uncharacterized protein n=1 Tax=Bartonella alsatica IBS 382 TaxID=1094551 RepID=J1IWV6_9HYPH|nr:hypothetical protein MEC_00280 [Bartonella alsatica IBS 382]